MLQFIALTLLLAALVCFWLARRGARASGLPFNARVVYTDTGAWARVEKPLFSEKYALAGKPDYLVAERGAIIPVEVKPNRAAPAPLESDVMQLVAYALLVAEAYGKPPAYGLLKYRDAVFRIEMTRELWNELRALLEEMRADGSAAAVARSHAEPRKCRACGFRDACGQTLV